VQEGNEIISQGEREAREARGAYRCHRHPRAVKKKLNKWGVVEEESGVGEHARQEANTFCGKCGHGENEQQRVKKKHGSQNPASGDESSLWCEKRRSVIWLKTSRGQRLGTDAEQSQRE
jgi:hypothetical protein